MNLSSSALLEARKTPVQMRSTGTVEAIFEATLQVLLRAGADRLTTTRVAERAGVSVGTLYQYYPNKQALLFAVLERHLGRVMDAVERACREQHGQPLANMVEAVVTAFVDAKMERRDASAALYAISSDVGGEELVKEISKRGRVAMIAMLRTAPVVSGVRRSQVEFVVMMLLAAMSGTTRAVLEAGAPAKMVGDLRRHLVLLGVGYLQGVLPDGPTTLGHLPNEDLFAGSAIQAVTS